MGNRREVRQVSLRAPKNIRSSRKLKFSQKVELIVLYAKVENRLLISSLTALGNFNTRSKSLYFSTF
ncbi:hypothetical protein Y032_0166g64 [Ancylostoma ceylanicum]|uniref:Uncharacterized protein n=1 Tax=Ancylostoma ceylanicum TaxID=53326 RepID=A0A016SVW6_9BILA|nr:hypothetical protein Y032_0166g64 [Ancylostoma ceylanicum]